MGLSVEPAASTRDSGSGLGRDSRSGFRPTGAMEGTTGLPVGLHIKGLTNSAIFATVAFGLRLLWN